MGKKKAANEATLWELFPAYLLGSVLVLLVALGLLILFTK